MPIGLGRDIRDMPIACARTRPDANKHARHIPMYRPVHSGHPNKCSHCVTCVGPVRFWVYKNRSRIPDTHFDSGAREVYLTGHITSRGCVTNKIYLTRQIFASTHTHRGVQGMSSFSVQWYAKSLWILSCSKWANFYLNDCYVTTTIYIFQHNIHYIELHKELRSFNVVLHVITRPNRACHDLCVQPLHNIWFTPYWYIIAATCKAVVDSTHINYINWNTLFAFWSFCILFNLKLCIIVTTI